MAQLLTAVKHDLDALNELHKEAKWAAYGVGLFLKHLVKAVQDDISPKDLQDDIKGVIKFLDEKSNEANET